MEKHALEHKLIELQVLKDELMSRPNGLNSIAAVKLESSIFFSSPKMRFIKYVNCPAIKIKAITVAIFVVLLNISYASR